MNVRLQYFIKYLILLKINNNDVFGVVVKGNECAFLGYVELEER